MNTLRFALSLVPLLSPSFALAQDESQAPATLAQKFASPAAESYPEARFHLGSGDLHREALTHDLEAISQAKLSGIQVLLGHGRGQLGTGLAQDDAIAHIAAETTRLGLGFTIQSDPGSGSSAITPDEAMRHLIWSRQDLTGGEDLSLQLLQPEPSDEDWRDYREVAVLAFPTPAGDDGAALIPEEVSSSHPDLPWADLLAGDRVETTTLPASEKATWVEVAFAEPVYLRTIELPPVQELIADHSSAPDSRVSVQVPGAEGEWTTLTTRAIPRSNRQEHPLKYPLYLAIADAPDGPSDRYRILIENGHEMDLKTLRLSSAARTNDWRAQAGYALRSLERSAAPTQAREARLKLNSIIDLSEKVDKKGLLTWKAPVGNWTILRYGHINAGVAKQVAPPEAITWEYDKLSPAGAEQHFAASMESLPADKMLQGLLVAHRNFPPQVWTPKMEMEFANRRKYSLRPWLPALAGYVVESHTRSERFLRDWRQNTSDLLEEHYFGRLGEFARERGLALSVLSSFDDVSSGDVLKFQSQSDIPLSRLEAHRTHPTVSAAHTYGRNKIAAESLSKTSPAWSEDPFAMKAIADRYFGSGVNHLVLDSCTPTTSGHDFTSYLARCQTLLQSGQPVTDVLAYLGDEFDHQRLRDGVFPAGYHFDSLNQDVLLNRLEVVDGRLQTPEGNTWQVLWLPEDRCKALTPETLYRLHALISEGATVIAAPPTRSPSLSNYPEGDKIFRAMRAEIWGKQLTESGDLRLDKGRLLWGGDLGEIFTKIELAPDLAASTAITWCHRRAARSDFYFLAAPSDTHLDSTLSFRAMGVPSFWDPLTGVTRAVPVYQQGEGRTRIPIQLPAAGSIFVKFSPGDEAPFADQLLVNGKVFLDPKDKSNGANRTSLPKPRFEILADGAIAFWKDGDYEFKNGGEQVRSFDVKGAQALTLKGGWSLQFPETWQVSESLQIDRIKRWSELDDLAAKNFSGTASYLRTFKVGKPKEANRYLLDLGEVSNFATVKINGHALAAQWAPPFRFDLTGHLVEGENELEIAVTNTSRNWEDYEQSRPPNKRPDPAPEDAAPDPSGLAGPVVLHIGRVETLSAE